ncbi:hypothetical protein B0H13DRAFT_2476801 [Mycena leptocephala]|nr:hypothetical protein B0H13DRAFT_2476801 [Mycena leptocephala]
MRYSYRNSIGHKRRSRTHQDYGNFGAADIIREHFRQVDEDLSEEILGDEYITLRETLASIELPPAYPPSEPSKLFGKGPYSTCEGLDFQGLIRQRKQHQTRQAAHCTRTKVTRPDNVPEESTRRQILRQFHELLKKSDQARTVGSSVEREARWRTDLKVTAAGNSANAAAAVSTREAKLPAGRLAAVSNAGLTKTEPLRIDEYGIVWTEVDYGWAKVRFLSARVTANTVQSPHTIIPVHSRSILGFKSSGWPMPVNSTIFLRPQRFFTHINFASSTVHVPLPPFGDLNSSIKVFDAAVKLSRSRKKVAGLDEAEDKTEDF